MRLVRALLLGMATAAPTALLSACGPGLPSMNRCSDPTSEGITALSFLTPSDGTQPVADLQAHPLLSGPQGGSMVQLRFGLPGQAVPTCASFEISVELCTNLECTETEDAEPFVNTWVLETFEAAGGRSTQSFLTEVPYRFGPGSLIRVSAKAAEVERSLLMWLEREGQLLDAGPRDGGLFDAGVSDALALDAMP